MLKVVSSLIGIHLSQSNVTKNVTVCPSQEYLYFLHPGEYSDCLVVVLLINVEVKRDAKTSGKCHDCLL